MQRALAWIEPEYYNASAPIIKKAIAGQFCSSALLRYQSEVLRHASM
jgi:hypothetical protein